MKGRIFILGLSLSFLGIITTGCPPPLEEFSAVDIAVNGMTCDECVDRITEAVANLDGVHAVSVDLKEKIASVKFEVVKLKLADIEHAIAEAGFDVAGNEPEAQSHDAAGCCAQKSL